MKEIASSGSIANTIGRGCIYVDKTRYIYELVKHHERIFISRPRRFGKTLTLDVIYTLFKQGVEPYFKDTFIYDKWTFGTYPVLRINFLAFSLDDVAEFTRQLCDCLSDAAAALKLEQYRPDPAPNVCLRRLLDALEKQGRQLVILIDEYDCQLTANLNNPELYEPFRLSLRSFYGALKDRGEIRFLAVTGVTRLKDVSVLSATSDIEDLTYESAYSELMGFTRAEIKHYYSDYLKLGISCQSGFAPEQITDAQVDELLDRMSFHYDGFCFDEFCENHVYSTWSVNKFLAAIAAKGRTVFGDYWYVVGGLPSVLAGYLKTHTIDPVPLLEGTVKTPYEEFVNPSSLLLMPQSVLMCQSGYLTLKSPLTPRPRYVRLGLANREVTTALSSLLSLTFFTKDVDELTGRGVAVLKKGNAEAIVTFLNELAAALPYDHYPVENESVLRGLYQFYFMGCLGDGVTAEQENYKGRSDIRLDVGERRVVLELKFSKDGSDAARLLEEGSRQILQNDYGRESLHGRKLIRLTAVFCGAREERRFISWRQVD
ncbi:MAG: AAA family ATPase [Succinivibrio sp.]|nr:AAA family ATPase [Succinivibrio sp.]